MKKKLVSFVLALSMSIAAFAGCGEKEADSKTSAETAEKETSESSSDSNFNETGYPIVNEKITLKVGVSKSQSYMGEWQDLDWTKQLEEESGIHLEFVVYEDTDAINMMFVDRDYPDISFCIGSDKQMKDAIAAGDVVALDEYKEYAPNWFNYFEENDDARKFVTSDNGSVYEFPLVRDEPQNKNLRDQWFIQQRWLDELGLEIPTTTNEFHEVLKAFKDNAGTGTIPEDVVPYYLYGITNHIGGALDLINSFGVGVNAERWYVTVDDDGKVAFNFANEAIKEPMEYIHMLVEEGLVDKDGFTDDWNTYLTKAVNNNNELGVFHTALNPNAENITAMGPLDTGNGKAPIMRVQTNSFTHYGFVLYKNCEYPEAAVRLANLIAEPDWSIQGLYGMFDDTYMTKNDDGTYVVWGYEANAQCMYSCPHNRAPLLCTEKIFDKLTYDEGNQNYLRAKAVEELYSQYSMDRANCYPNLSLSDKNVDRISELYTDISNYVSATLSDWALNGGIEEGWDGYVQQLEALGLEEYMALLQEELDAYNAK